MNKTLIINCLKIECKMKILVSLSVAGLLLLASCGGKGKDAASMSYSQEDANEVIAYYNITVDLMKKLVTTDDISKTLAYMKKTVRVLL